MKRALCAVALLALAGLLIRAARLGLAGDYIDPISRITAQDEALYSGSAIDMARNGHWLTSLFLGRSAPQEPFLEWVAALSVRIGGVSRLALRFPVALACSLALGLIFLWAAELRTWQASACAAALLASSHLWHVLGSMCMTDGLLAAFFIAAMYCLFSDPWMESRSAFWGFAAAVAGAILTSSAAGLLPLGALILYWLLAAPKYKPAFSRVCLAAGVALALAAPWFAYQMLAHGRPIGTEHVGIDVLDAARPQEGAENPLLFYAMRMALLDPVLTAASLVALPAFVGAARKRSPAALLLLCWVVVVLISVSGWQTRNVSYLLPLIPAMAIVSCVYGPVAQTKPPSWILILAGAALFWKVIAPDTPWGISFREGTVQPVAPVVSSYCQQERANELILVGMDDNLYATTLPLSSLRYAIERSPENEGQHFPGGTRVVKIPVADFPKLVQANPAADFLFPDRYRQAVQSAAAVTHVLVDAEPGHFLLLSRQGRRRSQPPAWSCWL